MTGLVEKNYGDALFQAVTEEKPEMLETVRGELKNAEEIFKDVPEFVKLMKTPTVTADEKAAIIKEAFQDKVSDYTYRFLMLLAENGRMDCFGRICRHFNGLCNERMGIAEITVVSTAPLSEGVKAKLKLKMTEVTGKTITLREETDPSLIGGIVVKYGSTCYDGSIKAKLNALKADIGNVVC